MSENEEEEAGEGWPRTSGYYRLWGWSWITWGQNRLVSEYAYYKTRKSHKRLEKPPLTAVNTLRMRVVAIIID